MNKIKLQSEFDPEATPNSCILNVHNRIAKDGGKAISGWLTGQLFRGQELFQQVHHCVWQKPDGEIVDITPQLLPQNHHVADLAEREFIPDQKAEWTKNADGSWVSLPGKWITESQDKNLKLACEELERSERAFNRDGDWQAANYWTEKAERHAKGYQFTRYNPGTPRMKANWPV